MELAVYKVTSAFSCRTLSRWGMRPEGSILQEASQSMDEMQMLYQPRRALRRQWPSWANIRQPHTIANANSPIKIKKAYF